MSRKLQLSSSRLALEMSVPIGILTVSDRASAGKYPDESGPAIREVLGRWLASSWHAEYRIVADEQDRIEHELRELSDKVNCALVVTTGGTGPAKRDVTPEATAAVCDRILPGFGEHMRAVSQKGVPTAILSRQIAGTRGSTLIVNLPGKPKAIEECLGAIFSAVAPCIKLIGGPMLELTSEAPPFAPSPRIQADVP